MGAWLGKQAVCTHGAGICGTTLPIGGLGTIGLAGISRAGPGGFPAADGHVNLRARSWSFTRDSSAHLSALDGRTIRPRISGQAYLWAIAICHDNWPRRSVWLALTTHIDVSLHGLYGPTAQPPLLFLSTRPIQCRHYQIWFSAKREAPTQFWNLKVIRHSFALGRCAVASDLFAALSDFFNAQEAIKILPVAVAWVGGLWWIWAGAGFQPHPRPVMGRRHETDTFRTTAGAWDVEILAPRGARVDLRRTVRKNFSRAACSSDGPAPSFSLPIRISLVGSRHIDRANSCPKRSRSAGPQGRSTARR